MGQQNKQTHDSLRDSSYFSSRIYLQPIRKKKFCIFGKFSKTAQQIASGQA